jgi:TPR repeat protein
MWLRGLQDSLPGNALADVSHQDAPAINFCHFFEFRHKSSESYVRLIYALPLFALALAASSSAYAAGSMLRITCEGDDIGAEVLINDKFRGECPIDLQVPEGALKLLVRKKAEGGRERVFEQDIRMGEGSVKKVEARLGMAKLNAGEAARQAENIRRIKGMTFDALLKEAGAGNAEAMYYLARNFGEGENGAPKNLELEAAWYRKAAEAGNVKAMTMWSAILADGDVKGVPQDLAASHIWARKAAETGHVLSMTTLAERYHKGALIPKNDVEALRWYRRAAEQGDMLGILSVAVFYYNGWGVTKSNEEAVAWWRKAADVGNLQAMYELGGCYADGAGMAASEEQAIYWWRKAAEGNYPDAVKELKKRGLR